MYTMISTDVHNVTIQFSLTTPLWLIIMLIYHLLLCSRGRIKGVHVATIIFSGRNIKIYLQMSMHGRLNGKGLGLY